MVIIGSARIDENNNINGGKAGDQTKKEVSTQNFYMHKKGWYAFKPKSKDVAKKLAQAMMDACANDHIGYDQSERLGVFNFVNGGTKIKNISLDTECDCSGLVRACILEATGIVVPNFNTSSEPSALKKSGLFEDAFVVKGEAELEEGMILCTMEKGHTVIVTEAKQATGSSVKVQPVGKLEPSKYKDKTIAGTYSTVAELNLRAGAGVTKPIISVMPFGSTVKCYGFYNTVGSDRWYAVEYEGHTGYCSSKYLKRQ